ncbi:hypothetical protein NKH77_49355 [Streptomyces sp. M19]
MLSWLNISRHGLVHGTGELTGGAADIDADATAALLAAHPDTVRGIKVRMSRSVLGDSGLAPLRTATALARSAGCRSWCTSATRRPRSATSSTCSAPATWSPTPSTANRAASSTAAGSRSRRPARRWNAACVSTSATAAPASPTPPRNGPWPWASARTPSAPTCTPVTRTGRVRPDHHHVQLLALGMPLVDVIRRATLHPARVLGLEGEWARCGPGPWPT